MPGPSVSRTKVSISRRNESVSVTVAESYNSRGSSNRFLFWSIDARSRYFPGGTLARSNRPRESATAMYRAESRAVGTGKASINARGAGFSASQSKTMPRTWPRAMVGPVENTNVRPSESTFPSRSESPGSMVTEYVVFGRKPPGGLTEICVRRHDTPGLPWLGEIRKSEARSAAPCGRSPTTSSNWKVTPPARTLTALVSGRTRRIFGPSKSSGPPGGVPGDAQLHAATAKSSIVRRRTTTPLSR